MKRLFALAAIAGCAVAAGSFTHGAHGAFPGANGRIAFTRQAPYDGGVGQIVLANADGSGLVALTSTRGWGSNNAQPTWSPDGDRIAFESTRRGDTDLWSVAPDASNLKELTFSVGFDGDPSWNPSGTKIAFETSPNGKLDIWTMNADGSGQQQLTDSPALDAIPSYSPDGKHIVFESDRGAKGNRDVYVSDLQGTDQHRLFADPGWWDVAP